MPLEDNSLNNKRIARNTVVHYFRMVISMVVSLYTSRVILDTLGVEDYGIYVVVGGLVSMFSILNASMSSSTARFLAYEMGQGDGERLRKTFCSALIIHIIIAGVLVLLAETIGLWGVYNKLVIPEGRMTSSLWVYQLSVMAAVLAVTQVPYNSTINAHEKMEVFAYIEIIGVSLKLIAAISLPLFPYDKLIVYALLILIASFVTRFIARIYCITHFEECRFKLVFAPTIFKPMLKFSFYNLYGESCITARREGTTIITNMFYGPILNTASSIASTIEGTVSGLAWKSVAAAAPQIVKSYARGDYSYTNFLISQLSRFSTLVYLLIAIPLIIETEAVITLWLGDIVPRYTFVFSKLAIIAGLFSIMHAIFGIAISATGDNRRLSLISGSIYLANLVVLYVALLLGYSPYIIFILYLFFAICIFISNLFILKRQMPIFSLHNYMGECLLPLFFISLLAGGMSYYSCQLFIFENTFFQLVVRCCISWIITIPIILFFALSKYERKLLFSWLKQFIHKIK